MKNTALHLAIRELQTAFSSATLWLIMGSVGVVLSLSGAFGTGDALAAVPRTLYWVGMVPLTYALGSLISGVVRRTMAARPRWQMLAVICCATGVGVTLLVLGVNTALFGWFFDGWRGAAIFALTTIAAAAVVAITIDTVLDRRPVEQVPPPIMARLPVAKRGQLISMSSVDHYVDVVTDKGSDLILMRLSDAILLTSPVPGLHIHRSHWVARNQITEVTPATGKASVTLRDGRTLPVSRANLAKLREAGLLPR
ncbi:MAG: LytTR family DNA-binding domain-containing protein [Pseudomonadota bacterium]